MSRATLYRLSGAITRPALSDVEVKSGAGFRVEKLYSGCSKVAGTFLEFSGNTTAENRRSRLAIA
jgi:hypothetical protein